MYINPKNDSTLNTVAKKLYCPAVFESHSVFLVMNLFLWCVFKDAPHQ